MRRVTRVRLIRRFIVFVGVLSGLIGIFAFVTGKFALKDVSAFFTTATQQESYSTSLSGAGAVPTAQAGSLPETSSTTGTEGPNLLSTQAPAPSSTTAAATTTSTDVAPTSIMKSSSSLAQARARPRMSIHDGEGKPVPVLEAIANKSYPDHWVSGTLRETFQRSDDLQGIISSHLILEIVITDISGVTVEAFVLETSGAGFTDASAHNQAQQRLAESLRDRIRGRTQ